MRLFLPSLVVPLVMTACSTESSLGARAAQDYSSTATTFWSGGDAAETGTTDLPGEIEDDFLAMRPAQTEAYVFVANPNRDTLSRIEVATLAVQTTQVGVDPRLVQTTPDNTTAVVFNRGDDTISLIDVETLDETVVSVREDFNSMKLSPDGRYAVLWHDLDAERADDPPAQGLQSFNEASFVDLTTGDHFAMAVGFNPRDVVFAANGDIAAVVSDGYLATVDLNTQPLLPSLITLTTALEPPEAEEVVVAPDGHWAFVRQLGTTEVLVVDLINEQVDAIPVGDNPTDLDLSPDGTEAVVLCRGSHELWVLQVDDPMAAPVVHTLPTLAPFGSLIFDPTGSLAIVYTTASLVDQYVSWDRSDDSFQVHGLVKPVQTMAITPDGGAMMAFHTLSDAPDTPVDSPFLGSWALTLIDLGDFRTNPLRLPAEPVGYSMSDDGTYAYFGMIGEQYLEVVDFNTLLHEQIELRSDPVYVGVLPDLNLDDDLHPHAWISQDHDLGRISFYDPNDMSLETITGFELNSGIE
ncbi:MAG: hypothetical protein GWP91_14075 [Rhodobacterales bacterium]|nr:hypothetical protein [Rhodobacterales bacterium]